MESKEITVEEINQAVNDLGILVSKDSRAGEKYRDVHSKRFISHEEGLRRMDAFSPSFDQWYVTGDYGLFFRVVGVLRDHSFDPAVYEMPSHDLTAYFHRRLRGLTRTFPDGHERYVSDFYLFHKNIHGERMEDSVGCILAPLHLEIMKPDVVGPKVQKDDLSRAVRFAANVTRCDGYNLSRLKDYAENQYDGLSTLETPPIFDASRASSSGRGHTIDHIFYK